MKRVIIFSNSQNENCLPMAKRGAAYLAANGMECFGYNLAIDGIEKTETVDGFDLALVFGGDGTILNASRLLMDRDIPVMGINVGHLGYLAAGETGDMEKALKAYIDGNYTIEERVTLCAKVNGQAFNGVNEAVLHRGGQSHLLQIRVFVNGQEADYLRADGIMAATPTGSTAYNLSAGGPLIVPTAENLVITPICAHSLGARPLVVSKHDEVEFTVNSRADCNPVLSVDGNLVSEVPPDGTVTVSVGSGRLKLIRVDKNCFFRTLRKKLSFQYGEK